MDDFDSENPTEHIVHAKHAAHADGDNLSRNVAVAVALMAIIAATIGNLQETESSKALGLKNESVLLQAKASDQWSFFQAKSIKKNGYLIAAEQAKILGQDPADFNAKAQKYAAEENEVQNEAKRLESDSHARWVESDEHTHHQHTLTLAMTLLHSGIAISSLAIFIRRILPLYGAIGLTLCGIFVTLFAYLA